MTPQALADIHAAAFHETGRWTADEIAALLAMSGALLVTEPGGFLLGRTAVDEAEILTVAVHPDARRKGIAQRLLAAFESAAAQAGAEAAFLEVAADNLAARALYETAGYAQVGQRKGYYRRPDVPAADALVLRKDLRPATAAK